MWAQLRNSVTAKVLFIGFLVLLLLIPMGMIRGVITERNGLYHAAQRSVMASWGRPQTLAAPILTVPYDQVVVYSNGERSPAVTSEIHILPTEVHMVGSLETQLRHRGIHEVPVYIADFAVSGRFEDLNLAELGLDEAGLRWEDAVLALPVSDARPIKSDLLLSVGEVSQRFEPGGIRVNGFDRQIVVPLKRFGGVDEATRTPESFSFSYRVRLGGSDRIRFLPLGDSTTVEVRSSWPAPSFVGAHAPDRSQVTDEGFEAAWQVVHLGRGYPSRWFEAPLEPNLVAESAFGVDLFQPVGTYKAATRAAKYAVLFIGLSFIVFFLFEVLAKLRLHPLQYLLVGFANCIFYLLLVALSEHIAFGWAYLVSACASIVAICGYSSVTLAGRGRAAVMTAALTLMYGFLYLTLNQEDYAMLGGAIALFGALVALMYVTRNIDWYEVGGLPSAAGEIETVARDGGV